VISRPKNHLVRNLL